MMTSKALSGSGKTPPKRVQMEAGRQGRWRLTDAKAKFSEVVKLARHRPQRVTVDGEDAVVIVSAKAYDREHPARTGADLVRAFAHPGLAELELGREAIMGPLREIDL
jgi:antitoxin Phd